MTDRVSTTDTGPQQHLRSPGAKPDTASPAPNATIFDLATNSETPSGSILPHTLPSSSVHDQNESQEPMPAKPMAAAATQTSGKYRSVGVQTLPPKDGRAFHKIYDREPTEQELVSSIGSGAIGRYGPGPTANPHDVVLGTSFPTPTVSNRRANYVDSSFQTEDVAQCKKALLRAKVKASILVSKQRDAARSAGFRVWSETREGHIIHSEQIDTSIQFDAQGNAINANVNGLSLPNIYGEEIRPIMTTTSSVERLHHRLADLEGGVGKKTNADTPRAIPHPTPPPSLPSPVLHAAVDDISTPQRIRTVEPRIPSEKSDPASIEHYGYFELVSKEATFEDASGDKRKSKKQQKRKSSEISEVEAVTNKKARSDDMGRKEIVMVFGGERFADEYIVYDSTALDSVSTATSPEPQPDAKKKRKAVDECEPQSGTISPKRLKSSVSRTHSPETGTSAEEDHLVGHQTRDATMNVANPSLIEQTQSGDVALEDRHKRWSSPLAGTYHGEQDVENDRYSRDRRADRDSRRRSRSPVFRHQNERYKSRSSTRRPSDNRYEAERWGHEAELQSHQAGNAAEQEEMESLAQREKDREEIILARKKEDDRRLQRAKQTADEKLERRRRLEEAEIQRAREAKNQRRIEIEEKKRAQEEDLRRLEEEKDRQRLRRRDESQDRSRRAHQTIVSQQAEPAGPVDEYAVAREAEARRREQVFAARSIGETKSRARERSPLRKEDSGRLEVERQEPEKKVEDEKATRARPRPSRTARGEIERYDPKKKFGRGG